MSSINEQGTLGPSVLPPPPSHAHSHLRPIAAPTVADIAQQLEYAQRQQQLNSQTSDDGFVLVEAQPEEDELTTPVPDSVVATVAFDAIHPQVNPLLPPAPKAKDINSNARETSSSRASRGKRILLGFGSTALPLAPGIGQAIPRAARAARGFQRISKVLQKQKHGNRHAGSRSTMTVTETDSTSAKSAPVPSPPQVCFESDPIYTEHLLCDFLSLYCLFWS